MAHNVEPMDIDNIDSDFDNKENSIHHSNVYPRTPCTEKGYEELDVSELNMKLRYSITPASSPMSKSYTANSTENRGLESGDDNLNSNLTRSLHSAITKGDNPSKSIKSLPLQTISSEQLSDSNRNTSVLRPLDTTTAVVIDNNVTITVTGNNDADENLSFPSSSSSTVQTPEATTPTKDIIRSDGGSPIMRGLKSVLNMFRTSQSPIPPADNANNVKQVLSPDVTEITPDSSLHSAPPVLASTPLAANKHRERNLSKRNSPLKESLVFNEDLEKELLWKDETTILFSQEKIPIHKLFFQQGSSQMKDSAKNTGVVQAEEDLNSTVEYMDVSYNDSMLRNKTITELQGDQMQANESDAEFVDCETTFTNENNGSNIIVSVDNVKKVTSTVTDIVSAIQAERSIINTEMAVPPLFENQPPITTISLNNDTISLPEIQQPNTTIPVNNETINISQGNTEPEIKNNEQDNNTTTCIEAPNNIINNVNDIKQDTKEMDRSIDENAGDIIESDVKPEPHIRLDATIDQHNSIADASSVNIAQEPLPDVTFDNHPVNTTFDTSKIPTDVETLPSNVTIPANETTESNNTVNVSIAESVVLNTEHEATFVKEIEDKPTEDTTTISNNTQNALITDAFILSTKSEVTSVKDFEEKHANQAVTVCNNPEITQNSKAVVDTECETTFVKEIESKPKEDMAPITNNSVITDSAVPSTETAILKEMESHQIDSEINTTANAIENIVSNNTPRVSLDVTANIPLPDDEDIENEKSIGAEMLADEGTILFSVNYTTITESENVEPSEAIPNVLAKSMDVNNAINDCSAIKDFVATNTEHIIEQIRSFESNQDNSSGINLVQEEINPVEMLPVHESMDINDIIYDVQVTDEALQSNTPIVENTVEQNLILNLFEDKLDHQMTPTDIASTEISDTDASHTANAVEISQISDAVNSTFNKEKNTHSPDSQSNFEDNPVINDATATKGTVDIDSLRKQEFNESQKSKVLNTTAVISDIAPEKPLEEAALGIEHNVVVKVDDEAISIMQQNSENIFSLADVADVTLDSNTVNNDKNLNVLSVMPIISKGEDRIKNANDVVESVQNKDEEITLSESNSPYVSLARQLDQLPQENLDNPFATKVLLTPPSSPKIVSKGYNFNFDEIDDPFATKTKIRMSPTPDISEKPSQVETTFTERPPQKDVNKNHRKSQPGRKKPVLPKKKINSTFSGSTNSKSTSDSKTEAIKPIPDIIENQPNVHIESKDVQISQESDISASVQIDITKTTDVTSEHPSHESASNNISKEEKSEDVRDIDTTMEVIKEANKSSIESLNETKTISSSEQSTYYSANTSSGEGPTTRNVFNLPEIDDMNFDPFVTKSKMCQSPPPTPNTTVTLNDTQELPKSSDVVSELQFDATFTENPFGSKCKMRQSPPPSLNTTATVNSLEIHCSSETLSELKSEPVRADFEFNKDFESKAFDDKEFGNLSNTTCSSKATDEKDNTVREMHTDEEDTIEGPFLEAEVLNYDEKMSDFDVEDVDMMQFSELPPQSTEENVDGGELFIDAEAFEFLLNQNKSNVVADSGKESLFLKFDPLFAKRMSSDGVLAALNKVKRQSTPKKMSSAVSMDSTFDKSIAGPSTLSTTHEVATNSTAEESTDDFNVTVSKPMMVVTPAVNPIVTPRNKTTTPPSSNRRSITFTSPAIAVIDRLLSLSANNSLIGHDTTVTHMSREQTEADLALTQLRELLAEKEINVYNLRTESKELKDRLSSMESQMRILESEGQGRLKKINDLNEKLSEKTKLNKSMAAVVEEYERTIASLIAETEQDKKRNNEERIRLIKERDEQTAHLASMEVSFSDLHSKYEKSKQIILTCKANEDSYKKSIKEFEENLSKMQSNYELLKQHATSKLNHANQELEKINRSHEAEVLKLNAMIKRKELHITSLEETLAQKTKANEELTAICDELINKVG